ncbi:MAG: undecaprenyl/decaprenyl-phosphate alpha-N-acetylglucosaminyl 1-phosphate transferase, partial [Planctomycetes bacterium]|nr:undecaprenyl/decaprenyl-phosphate alpha-N-acetylglucosaminyl 1-phosphate transferase [Planctomycetota bacterium]
AAALAIEEVGVKVASGVIIPFAQMINESLTSEDLILHLPVGSGSITIDLVYWVGTAIIAMFVLGGCNAANLIDGLDGLLTGVTAIIALGLLLISLIMAVIYAPDLVLPEDTTLAGARIVLCLAVLGAVLGFLPYNFNPASIFLGDSGSLLLGYCSVVVILMLGDEGLTYLVCCGLIIFSIPIIDTVLAITRRKMAGMDISGADDQHLHHKLKRALGGVKRAVWALYGMGIILTVFGVGLAAVVMLTPWRARLIYITTTILYAAVVIIAIILARRQSQTNKKPIIASDASSPPSSGDN